MLDERHETNSLTRCRANETTTTIFHIDFCAATSNRTQNPGFPPRSPLSLQVFTLSQKEKSHRPLLRTVTLQEPAISLPVVYSPFLYLRLTFSRPISRRRSASFLSPRLWALETMLFTVRPNI